MMASIFSRHTVEDYQKWLDVYNSIGDLRDQHGCTADRIWRAVDAPNEVMAMYEFATVEEAKAFLASPLFQLAMERAGIAHVQRIEYFQDAN